LEAEVKQTAVAATSASPPSEDSEENTQAVAPEHTVAPIAVVHQTASVATPETLGAVYLTSNPSGADVYVDDGFVGKTPITLNLKSGHHYVRTFENGYKNWSQLVTITLGAEIRLTATMEKSN
jgi:hypothetical protein